MLKIGSLKEPITLLLILLLFVKKRAGISLLPMLVVLNTDKTKDKLLGY
jgi:hypothetical protein